MAEEYKISLGIDLNDAQLNTVKKVLESIEEQKREVIYDVDFNIKNINKLTRVGKEIDEIKAKLKELDDVGSIGKGKSPIAVDSKSLEASLNKIHDSIKKLQNAFGRVDSNKGVQSLLTTINKIRKSLEDVSAQFEGLNKNLSALSSKDFSLNFDFSFGKSSAQNPEQAMKELKMLKKEIEEYQKYFSKFYSLDGKNTDPINRLMLQHNQRNQMYMMQLQQSMNKGSDAQRIAAAKEYIKVIKETAKAANIALEPVEFKLAESSEFIRVRNEASETEKQLKELFSGGIDAAKLHQDLTNIAEDLRKIQEFISNVSKDTHVDGLTQSFNKLSETLEKLSSNLVLAKDNIDAMSTGAYDGITSSAAYDAPVDAVVQGEERKRQALEQTADAYENTAQRARQAGKLISDSAQKAIDSVSSQSIDKAFTVDEPDSIAFRREMENLVSQWTDAKGQLTDIKINTDTFYDGDTGRNIEKITSAIVTYNNELGETIRKTIALRQIDTKVDVVDGTEMTSPIFGFVEVSGQYSKSFGKTKAQTDAFVKQQKQAVANLTNTINQANRSAIDQNASRPIKESSHLDTLKTKYNEIITAIQRMGSASSDTFVDEQNNVKTLISDYKSLAKEFRNAENASSQMKGNDYESGRAIAERQYKKFLADAQGFSVDTSNLNIDSVTDVASLNKFTDALRVAKAELSQLKAEATSAKRSVDSNNRTEALGIDVSDLRRNIESLQNISPEINNFKVKINDTEVTVESLLKSLSNINAQSDFRVARKNFESFTKAAQEAGIAVTKTQKESSDKKTIDSVYNKIYDTRKRIGSLEVDLIGAEAKKDVRAIKDINDEITRLKNNLASLEKDNIGAKFTNEQKESLKELRKQSQYNKKQAQNSFDAQQEKSEVKIVNDSYNEIYNTKKRIGSLEVDLISAEDTKDAQILRSEIERLKKSLLELDKDGISSKFTEKQKNSLKELENQIDFNKKQAENKVDAKLGLQIDKDDAAKAKKEAKETEDSFKELKRLATEMGKIDIELTTLTDVDKDIDKFNSLKRVAEELEVEFQVLREATNLNPEQIKELDQIFANTTGAVRELNNEMAESAETKELTSGLERLKSITKEIAQLKIDIFKFEDADNIGRVSNRLNELENEAAELRAELSQKFNVSSFDEIDDIARKGEEALNDLVAKVAEAKAKLANDIKLDIEAGSFDDDISKIDDKFNRLSGASQELRDSVQAVRDAYREMELAAGMGENGDGVVDVERLIQANKEYEQALEKVNNQLRIQAREEKAAADVERLAQDKESLKLDAINWLNENTRAAKEYGTELKRLISLLDYVDDPVAFKEIARDIKNVQKTAQTMGKTGLTAFDQLKKKAKEYMTYLSAAEMFMYAEQALRSMFEQVKLIDSAMTELKKVTDETDASYEKFLTNAASRAKEIGTTIDGLVSSTADFARLGYEFADAQGLAEVANIYAVVGDDIDSVETATQSLISTLTAFKDEAMDLSESDFALSIVDKMNEVSNNFAISSGGLGDALQRSASSMMAANNSLDETIALITAANTVVQDADSVGRLMPTLKMAISVKSQRWSRPRKDFISIFDTYQLGRICVFFMRFKLRRWFICQRKVN